MTGHSVRDFAGLLRWLRIELRLTQEELAEAAGVSPRTVSDLERGVSRTAHRDTARLLATALRLAEPVAERFIAAARGRIPAAAVFAGDAPAAGPAAGRQAAVTSPEHAATVEVAAGLADMAQRTASDLGLPVVLAAPQVRFSLPPDAAAFTGRGEELSRVTAAAADGARDGCAVVVCAIGGMAGTGKTALAVHAAYMLAGRFPDRQLFIDLHAHTPGREPVRADDALAALLGAVGVRAQFLPADLEGRAAMWRDKIAGQQALLVLDNAASTSQVAPLLPGGGDCLVLVTSRRHLGDLPGTVVPILLDVLAPGQALQMFTRLAPRAAASPDRAAEVTELARFLPLAIKLLARLFERHPSWTLAGLAADTRAELLTLTAENSSIAAAFGLSYQHLNPTQQRFFALIGLHPGGTTDSYAAAALADISPAEATRLLDGLHGEGLLTETGYRRYSMHDLLRRYARDHAITLPAEDAQRAVGRLLDYYTHTAALAQDLLARQTRPSPPPTTPAPPRAVPVLADTGQALAWARAERDSLLACLDHVTREHQHTRVTALTAALAELLRRDGPWTEAIIRHTTALHSAHLLADQPAEASTLNNLGNVRWQTGDYAGAVRDHEHALAIYHDLDNRAGQANTFDHLGTARWLIGDYAGAARDLEQALAIYHDLGDQLGQANTLLHLGNVRWLTGDYRDVATDLDRALAIYHDLGNSHGQADTLTNLAVGRRLTGDYPGAARILERALAIYHDLGNRFGQANVLHNLGAVRWLTGDYPGAARELQRALAIYRDIGNRVGQANTFNHLGTVRRKTGDYPGAAENLEQALAIYRDLRNSHGQATTLTNRAAMRRETGDYPGAARDLEQALAIYHNIGERHGKAEVLNETGTLHQVIGQTTQARNYHQQALDLARATGSVRDEAHALAGLSRCATAVGHTTQAHDLLRQAHLIFQRTGAAEAAAILAELNTLPTLKPAQ